MAALPVRADWLKLYKELLRAGREVSLLIFGKGKLLWGSSVRFLNFYWSVSRQQRAGFGVSRHGSEGPFEWHTSGMCPLSSYANFLFWCFAFRFLKSVSAHPWYPWISTILELRVILAFVPPTHFSSLKVLKNGQSVLGYRTRRAVSNDTKIYPSS